MKNFTTLIIYFIFTSIVFTQQFKLTDEQGSFFSFDKFTNEVYFSRHSASTGTIKKINLATKIITEVNFTSLPVFMHHSHKAIYLEITDSSNIYYLHDFEGDSTKQLYEVHFNSQLLKTNSIWPRYSISPDDTKLLNFSAFNIEDSSWIYLSDNVALPTSYFKQEWSSDSTFIFFSLNNALAEYNFNTGKVDTLVTKSERILNFTYNRKYNLLAYSTGDYNDDDRVLVYDKNTGDEKLVYGPSIDSIYCSMGTQEINDLAWSPNGNYLVFLSYDYTNPGTSINIYDALANKTTAVTECVGVGLKKNVIWVNNYTILYAYGNNRDEIYGFNLESTISTIRNNLPNGFNLSLKNYPNPFNPSTNIVYTIPNTNTIGAFDVRLVIYDVLGNEIITLVKGEQKTGTYEIKWDGKNSTLKAVSTGIYLARLVVNNKKNIMYKSIKILYLK